MEIVMTRSRGTGYEIFPLGVIEQLKCWYARHRQREQLLQMDDRALKDIGISRVDALSEGTKPFWKK
ncbi:MAG: DUF1127 domain-containing protein [Candidatus Sedimenticola sp. (ex Thyasira tokunagai)]